MLLTISTTHRPATDLGYLLHKNPARAQTFELAFGSAHVFYPEATPERCTAALLLDIDPLKLVRGPGAVLTDYVNDRPYVSSSFLSVAIARVFGTAMSGRCNERPELVTTAIPLETTLAAVPCRGAETLAEDLFAPLGYEVETATERDGERPRYRNVRLRATKTLAELLNHVYVLLPIADNRKHYWIGEAEVDKLLARGAGWLDEHPHRDFIIRRYLGHRRTLTADATARLRVERDTADDEADAAETPPAERASLHQARLDWAVDTFRAAGATRIVDVGCGEGRLLRLLADAPEFTAITGADASVRALEIADRRLKLKRRRRSADGTHPADPVRAHLPRPAPGRPRRRRRGRGHRAHRRRTPRRVRAGSVPPRQTAPGGADDSQPGVQRAVRRTRAGQAAPPRPPLRVDTGRVRELGPPRRRAPRVQRRHQRNRSRRPRSGRTHPRGGVPPRRLNARHDSEPNDTGRNTGAAPTPHPAGHRRQDVNPTEDSDDK